MTFLTSPAKCCCDGPPFGACVACYNGTPSQFQVVIAGIQNKPALPSVPCADCLNLNGSYVLDQTSACTWEYIFSGDCDATAVRITMTPVGITVSLAFDVAGSPQNIFWTKGLADADPGAGTAVDCIGLSNENIDGTLTEESGVPCDAEVFGGTDATAHVTAL